MSTSKEASIQALVGSNSYARDIYDTVERAEA